MNGRRPRIRAQASGAVVLRSNTGQRLVEKTDKARAASSPFSEILDSVRCRT